MPNVFRTIGDKTLARLTRARGPKLSQLSPQVPESDDGASQHSSKETLLVLDPGGTTQVESSHLAYIASTVARPTSAVETSQVADTITPETRTTKQNQSATSGVDHALSETGGESASSSLAAERRGVAFQAFKTMLGTMNEVAGIFPPLKSATGGLLSVLTIVDRAIQNQKEFNDVTQHLEAILATLNRYKQYGLQGTLEDHLRELSNKLDDYTEQIERLKEHSTSRRMAEGAKDSGSIVKIFHDIGNFLQRFQIDIALSTNALILQRQEEATIDRHLKLVDGASYNTRHRAQNDEPHGCMEGTREHILTNLDAWAVDDMAPSVYWLNGMAGTGKSSIAHTLCKRLDAKGMLSASFFCSRSDSALRDPRCIIPTIASMLARSSPSIRSELCQVLEKHPDAASLNSLPEQFDLLVLRRPVRRSVGENSKTCVIVIDAIDECSDQREVQALIEIILDSASDIPFKFFISSRRETWIEDAFRLDLPRPLRLFRLDDVDKDDVQRDIEAYIRSSLSTLEPRNSGAPGEPSQPNLKWPPNEEVRSLLIRVDGLFIYAATAVRYIRTDRGKYRQRLTAMTRLGSSSPLQTNLIDSLYHFIMEEAFNHLEADEKITRRKVLATVAFLETPLSIEGIALLLHIEEDVIKGELLPFHSVIHVPSAINADGNVSIFHASFRDFLANFTRAKTHWIDPSGGHQLLTEKCFQCLNTFLRRNICNLPKDTIGSRPHEISDLSVIPEALQYSSLHWASHLSETLASPPADLIWMLDLFKFADKHLLHWFECLSALRKLESGVGCLTKARESCSKYSETHPDFEFVGLLFDDARRCLQMGFEAMQLHCLNTYHCALAWIPRRSIMRRHYEQSVQVPEVLGGLSETWGPLEHIMHHSSTVWSVAISPCGCRVASGSNDPVVRIWSTTTGNMMCELQGHSSWITSVAFSSDGSRIVTGSDDKTARIWSVTHGKTVHVLRHFQRVTSVAFSPDGTAVVSGSYDKKIRVWLTDSGELKCVLAGHLDKVNVVAFSSEGSLVVSGSEDHTIRIWSVNEGELLHVLKGHSDRVNSVAFSSDGTQLVSGSGDRTIQIWNTHNWERIRTLQGHSRGVTSVNFSSDGTRLASGSRDCTIQIWDVATGVMERVLEGHQSVVTSVVCSRDGKWVVSASRDRTICTWNTETQRVLESQSRPTDDHARNIWATVRHTTMMKRPYAMQEHDPYDAIWFVFSPNGSCIISASKDTVRIWRTSTGEIERVLKGHSDRVTAVGVSPCGSHILSGSRDSTVRIWDATTGVLERVFEGHSNGVTCVAFSPCGSRIVSGSRDFTVRVWNTATGKEEHVLNGHSDWVITVAFSHDSNRVASGSDDSTVRIWNAATGELETVLKDDLRLVTCVGYSPDDSHVVSGDFNGTLQIWDITTRTPTVTLSCQLPGGREVKAIGFGRFQILDPGDQTVTTRATISSDFRWILGGSPVQDCLIAAEYRHRRIALSGSKVCIGYRAGHVVILDLP